MDNLMQVTLQTPLALLCRFPTLIIEQSFVTGDWPVLEDLWWTAGRK